MKLSIYRVYLNPWDMMMSPGNDVDREILKFWYGWCCVYLERITLVHKLGIKPTGLSSPCLSKEREEKKIYFSCFKIADLPRTFNEGIVIALDLAPHWKRAVVGIAMKNRYLLRIQTWRNRLCFCPNSTGQIDSKMKASNLWFSKRFSKINPKKRLSSLRTWQMNGLEPL